MIADTMILPTARLTKVEPVEDYKLLVSFDDGKSGIFDMKPYLKYNVFESLLDMKEFNKVHVECGTAVWSDEIDIAPERLYTDCVIL